MLGGVLVLGSDGSNALAGEADAVASDRRHVSDRHSAVEARVDVGAGDDGMHTWKISCLKSIDLEDASVGVRAMKNLAPEGSRRVNIGGIDCAARDLADSIGAWGWSADYAIVDHFRLHSLLALVPCRQSVRRRTDQSKP